MSATIHINPVAPQKLTMVCGASSACPDMTAVVSSVLKLLRPDAQMVSLTATLSNQTHDSCMCSHVFALGDVDLAGPYKIYAVHTLSGGGTVRSDTQQFQVLDNFA